MPIEFHCPFCDQMLRTPDEQAGRQAKCPGCGESIFVPHESEVAEEREQPQSAGGDWFDQLAELHAKPEAMDLVADGAAAGPVDAPAVTSSCPLCGAAVDESHSHCPACGETIGRGTIDRVQPAQPVYAGFWLRAAAALIDGVILAIPAALIVALALPLLAKANWMFLLDPNEFWLPELTILLLTWPYFAPLESSRFQATLGKMLLGLIVTDLNGDRLSFARATGRHWAKFISSFCLFLGYFVAGFDDRKQAWHDSIAGCLVVRRPVDWGSANESNDAFDDFTSE